MSESLDEQAAVITPAADPAAPVAPARQRRGPRRTSSSRRRAGRGAERPASPTPAGRPWELNTATLIAMVLLGVFGLVALFAGYLFIGSGLAENRRQDVMFGQLRQDLAIATVPVSAPIATGTPLGIVTIPKLGVEQVFVMGSSSEETLTGPGLRHDSALPGQAGVSVLVGRRAAGGAPFADLDRLVPGDEIDVTTGQGQFVYVVDVVRTSDESASGIAATDSRLTLVTSDPAITNTRTLQVSAAIDGDALPASTGAAAGVATAASDQPGESDHDRGIALLLWSQALLVVAVAATWAAVRLPGRAVWIGAVPVLLAVLWQVFANLTVLLPNTL